ncbi:hypothetical protein A2U01_0035260, partial [Trifolium medium]|nr:hypothetical protein [Trifolium medium]
MLECIRDVVEIGEGESRSWNLLWRRSLFQWEEESVVQLLDTIDNVSFSNEEDKWCWKVNPEGCFTVKTAYEALLREIVPGTLLCPWELKIFRSIWDSPAPSKVIAFSWQLLYDRVPTKENILLRGIINHDTG